jgi:hypothetical protein
MTDSQAHTTESHEPVTGSRSRHYIKSSRSGGSGGNCVEWAHTPAGVYIRDSKNPAGPELFATYTEWSGLLAKALTGAGHPWITQDPAGVSIRQGGCQLRFSLDEWSAFVQAIRAGECKPVAA